MSGSARRPSGPAAGAAAAVVVAIIAPPSWVLTTLAILAFLLAVMQRATYWRMYGLYTFALVLYIAAPDDVAFEAEERGLQFLAGIALLIVGLAILHRVGDRLARRGPGIRGPDPTSVQIEEQFRASRSRPRPPRSGCLVGRGPRCQASAGGVIELFRAILTASTKALITAPMRIRSRIIWAVTTARALWLVARMSPKPTVVKIVTVK